MTYQANRITRDKDFDTDKVINVFKFLKDMNLSKIKPVLNVKDYPWRQWLADIPEDVDHIVLAKRNTVDDDSEAMPELLSVQKPEFWPCPAPNKKLERWLETGWDDFHQPEAKYVEELPITDKKGEVIGSERFSESKLEKTFTTWQEKRRVWAAEQCRLEVTRTFFGDLYAQYLFLEREPESYELIVANGFLVDRENPTVNHPLVTQRVKLTFDEDSNTLTVLDGENTTLLESDLLASIQDINDTGLAKIRDRLTQEDVHPLDEHEMPMYLKALANMLSSKAKFINGALPEGWEKTERLVIYWHPTFIIRKRRSGAIQAIEHIIEL